MSNLSDIKPWFREDIERVMASIYFSMRANMDNREFLRGYLTALIGFGLVFGINPKSFLPVEDLQLLEVKK